MKSFPMFIRTTNRRVVVVGGGEQAAQKTRLILKSDAEIEIVWPELDPELAEVVQDGLAVHNPSTDLRSVFDGAAMAFIATGCRGVDAALQRLAVGANCPVNVVDQPELCTIVTPSIVDRDPVVIAIGTEGTAPVLARKLKTDLERQLPVTLGGLAALAGRLRGSVAKSIPRARRRAFWEWVFGGAPLSAWSTGAEREAARQIKEAIANGGRQHGEAGLVSIVPIGSLSSDLMTLRAVTRLQQADVIVYDEDIDMSVLELARRDAERVRIPTAPTMDIGTNAILSAPVVAAAKEGEQVVRVVGRSGAHATGLPTGGHDGFVVELVPLPAPEAGTYSDRHVIQNIS